MVTPGLLPEADDRRFPPFQLLPWLIIIALLGFIVWRGKSPEPKPADPPAPPPAPKEDVGRLKELEAEIARLRTSIPPAPPAPAPAKAPDIRVLPPDLAAERLTQGLHEFRSGRYAQAEACFLRAVPEGFLYLVLSCLARGDVREAMIFLDRAMKADPQWLRRVRPRDLFGSAEEFERTLRSLEERLKENPLDVEAKTLLAYLHYHEKGAEYAKALLTEVATAQPDHPASKAFLEAIDKP
jgi:tetratricopeptide (TPR) repeat protein